MDHGGTEGILACKSGRGLAPWWWGSGRQDSNADRLGPATSSPTVPLPLFERQWAFAGSLRERPKPLLARRAYGWGARGESGAANLEPPPWAGARRWGLGVGETGFEPATSSSQSWRATRLRYSPTGRYVLVANTMSNSPSGMVGSTWRAPHETRRHRGRSHVARGL